MLQSELRTDYDERLHRIAKEPIAKLQQKQNEVKYDSNPITEACLNEQERYKEKVFKYRYKSEAKQRAGSSALNHTVDGTKLTSQL